jgi:hypothetical protein
MGRFNTLQFEQSISKVLTLHSWVDLDQVIQDDRAR